MDDVEAYDLACDDMIDEYDELWIQIVIAPPEQCEDWPSWVLNCSSIL